MYNDTSNINRFIAFKNPFRYRSYYYDFETKLYYLNSRYYDPELGRFINADDISILTEAKDFPNGLNLYSYCNNNPVNLTDENGNAWWDWLWKILVAVVLVVAVTALVVLTAGAVASFLGASAAVASSIMSGAAMGGLVSGTISIVGQCINNGIDNFNFLSLAVDTFTGATFGAITAGAASIGTFTARAVGGAAKVLLSGLSTALNAAITGTPKDEAVHEILKSMLITSILQTTFIGGGKLFSNIRLGSNSSKFGQLFSNIFKFINNNTNLKILLIQGTSELWGILTERN